ncbi:response regulator transcription factor [Labrys wisconsinensis]|uniref:FixJ family two-component response regulator n=1 Tax=Labrys wisconsinensis TaxID=425677 RepID=A0ABU0J4B6_9HYPH|nr:response regulator [Labrys wisconsinensis]MDQ0468119.1 FixJ family two-component response regulator [Labrys wisconsinensis]
MGEDAPVVYVVDDDLSVRDGLDSLLRSVGYEVRCFGSARDFALLRRPEGPACLVLDVRMPGQGGLDFQQELARGGDLIPIVFLTGHGDVPMSVRALKSGAVDFLLKPFREQDLLDAIATAIGRDRERRRDAAATVELQDRFATLSAREREVMTLAVTGRLNKQIAAALGLSEVTVKAHRGQVMRKMRAETLVDLLRMADRLGLPAAPG